MNTEYGLKDIQERRAKISRLDELNDPFEFLGAELPHRDNRNALESTKARLSKAYGLMCFSKSWQNPVLWSHYADRHRGICLGFDVRDDLPKQVTYVNSRFEWPAPINEDFMSQLLFTKFSHWSYEDEYRWFTRLEENEDGIYYLDFSEEFSLKQVIVGALSPVTRAQLEAALGSLASQVETFKARPAFTSFQIVRNRNDLLWS